MKKLILGVALSLVMINCTSSDSVETSNSGEVASRVRPPYDVKRHYYDNGGNDYGCKVPAVNCLDDVIISGRMTINQFKDEVITFESLKLLNDGVLSLQTKHNTIDKVEYFILTKVSDNSVYEVYPTRY